MTEEDAFQASIDASPLDKLPRLVFCDWLDERGDERAEGMRVLAEFDRWPWLWPDPDDYWWCWYEETEEDLSGFTTSVILAQNYSDRSEIPEPWRSVVVKADNDFNSRRKAMDATALAWSELTAEQKARCLTALDVITGRKKPNPKANFALRHELL